MVLEIARHHELVVTIEENALAGGAGCAVNECLAARHVRTSVLNLGLPDRFIEHGTRDEALHDAGLDRDAIRAAILAREAQLARGAERTDDKRARRATARTRAAIVGPFFSG